MTTTTDHSPDAVRLVRYGQLPVKFSRTHLDRLEKAGRFPRRVHVGPHTVAWIEDEINQWIAARLSERD
jgi:prophage regulatory protein